MWGNSQQILQAITTETNTVNQAERRGSKITLWCSVATDRITVTVFFKNTTTSEKCAKQIELRRHFWPATTVPLQTRRGNCECSKKMYQRSERKVWQQNWWYQLPVTDLSRSGGSQIKSLQIKPSHIWRANGKYPKKSSSLSQELQTSTSYRGTRNVWRNNGRNFGNLL